MGMMASYAEGIVMGMIASLRRRHSSGHDVSYTGDIVVGMMSLRRHSSGHDGFLRRRHSSGHDGFLHRRHSSGHDISYTGDIVLGMIASLHKRHRHGHESFPTQEESSWARWRVRQEASSWV